MNGIVIVDKPSGWTSHDVVSKLRGIFHEKRIGHGGTLDPMATGVLPVFVGRATRAVPFCENAEKEYLAGFRPGIITDTQDTEGNILSTCDAQVSQNEFEDILSRFTGEIQQIPPMYSAVKIGGKKLYELARKGVEVERASRTITIHCLECIGRSEGDYLLRVRCSKGTYIRTLCHDIGNALGCGGCMSSLRRTMAGRFTLSDSVTMDEVLERGNNGTAESLLRPVDSIFDCPGLTISGEALRRCLNGNDFLVKEKLSDGSYRVYDEDGRFLMLGLAENNVIKTIKSFF